MPVKTGTVKCLLVADDYAYTCIEGDGITEAFVLWHSPGTNSGVPRHVNAYTRVMHSMWVSFLRDAWANNLTVRIVSSGGAVVLLVQIGTVDTSGI